MEGVSEEEMERRRKESEEILKTCVTDVDKLEPERTFIGKIVGIRAMKRQFEEGVDTTTITLFLETDFTDKLVPVRLRYSERRNSKYAEFLRAVKACGVKISSFSDLKDQKFEWKEVRLTYQIGAETVESKLLVPTKYIKA